MKFFKKVIKIVGIILLVSLVFVYFLFCYFTAPKTDKEIIAKFNTGVKPVISHESFNDFKYRKLSIVKDTTLPTLVFVHGTIGTSTDFIEYFKDSIFLSKFNMISYDRIGYNHKDENPVQESIAFEQAMLQSIISNLNPKKTILIGYSYGGPIALTIKNKVRKIVLLAPAVYSKVEPMPWAINFYKSKLTRWLIPDVWKEASKEKLSHQQDLKNFEKNWYTTKNNVISIHGTKDWIVPYENSIFLKNQFPENQFKLIPIKNAGHGLIWSNFKEVKQHLLKQLN